MNKELKAERKALLALKRLTKDTQKRKRLRAEFIEYGPGFYSIKLTCP